MRDPIAFQNRSRRAYFEGWYFKHVSPDGFALAVIPGISRDANGEGHAFVQVIRGADGATAYERFPMEEFAAHDDPFEVTVGRNRFSLSGIELDLPETFGGVRGAITYGPVRRPQRSLLRPGIMGWYRYVPRMECYHEVGSADHSLRGFLELGEESVSFDGGRGYLEKDWGTSMPSAWLWMQCNAFESPGSSIMLSIATIPWIGRSFTGFLGFVAPPADEGVETFGTWSGARIASLEIADDRADIRIESRSWILQIGAQRERSGSLAAPAAGAMDRRISESIDATVELRWTDRAGSILWEDRGKPAGMEIVGLLE